MKAPFRTNVKQLVSALSTYFVRRPSVPARHNSTATLNLSTSYQDIPGITTGSFTPQTNEYAVCFAHVFINQGTGTAACNVGDDLRIALDVNGVDNGVLGFVEAQTTGGRSEVSQTWVIELTGGTAYTLKIQATNSTGNRGKVVAHSGMVVWRVSRR